MSEVKWTVKDIICFLDIFQNYPCLWDVSSKDYLNRNLKDVSMNKLLEQLQILEIPSSFDIIKKRIKSLRDTYRTEVQKVQKSKKSGAGADDVYKPKLIWFSAAEVFWHGSVTGRESSSNLIIPQSSTLESEHDSLNNDGEHDSDTEHTYENAELVTPEIQSFVTPSTSASRTPKLLNKRPSLQTLPPKRTKLPKLRNKQLNTFENSINKLQQMAKLATEDREDQYDQFAKHLASQMRELPLRSFIVLQSKIQNLITQERLDNLYGSYNEPSQSGAKSRHESTGNTMYSASENTYPISESSETCFIDEELPQDIDVLNETLINICKHPMDVEN